MMSLRQWIVLVFVAALACDSTKDQEAAVQQLTQHCAINSDCSEPLVCAFTRCHEQCRSNRDCLGRANCVQSPEDEGLRICQLDSEVTCIRDADCSGEQRCAADGECRDECQRDADCAEAQVCVSPGVCAAEDEVKSDGGFLISPLLSPFDPGSFGGPAPTADDVLSDDDTGADDDTVADDDVPSDDDTGADDDTVMDDDVTEPADDDASGEADGSSPVEPGSLAENERCEDDVECESLSCDGVCVAPTCSDGRANGAETGMDCGGSCLARCPPGDPCNSTQDCASGSCVDGVCVALVCPGEAGVAEMVPLPAGFCIDSTEVTRAQYGAWLARAPNLADQSSECAGNLDFAPAPGCQPACQADCDDHPQVCIDWCDAVAYCAGVGKRLCGPLDAALTSHDGASLQSQWYYACSSAGASLFPYGEAYDDMACNTNLTSMTAPVGSLPDCQSDVPGFEGVFDMSGNVYEWTALCNESSQCETRGGGYYDNNAVRQACTHTVANGLATAAPNLGFRCCSH